MTTRTFPEADVKIFREDADGNIVDLDGEGNPSPLLTYCFAEGITISSKAAFQRRAVTGRGRRKIIPRSGSYDEVTINVNYLYTSRTTEYNIVDIFNSFERIQVWFHFNDVSLLPEEADIWKFSATVAPSYGLSGQGQDSILTAVAFEAERILDE